MQQLVYFTQTIMYSKIFWTLLLTYVVTHAIKVIVDRFEFGKWRADGLWVTGGMPSSHSSIVVALTTAVAFETGPSILFVVTAIFSLVTIRDSFGMQTSVGEQAKLLNVLVSKLNVRHKVHIVLGHTPLQVTIGCIVGFAVALLVYLLP